MPRRKCVNEKCSKHGLKLRGRARYCPACGDETVEIRLPFLAFHIDKKGSVFIGVCFALVAMSIFFYPMGVRGCEHRRAENLARRQTVKSLPTEWQVLYHTCRQAQSSIGALKELQKQGLTKELPPISGDQWDIFLGVFHSANRDDVVKYIDDLHFLND
jgi:hypothetical protein